MIKKSGGETIGTRLTTEESSISRESFSHSWENCIELCRRSMSSRLRTRIANSPISPRIVGTATSSTNHRIMNSVNTVVGSRNQNTASTVLLSTNANTATKSAIATIAIHSSGVRIAITAATAIT